MEVPAFGHTLHNIFMLTSVAGRCNEAIGAVVGVGAHLLTLAVKTLSSSDRQGSSRNR